MNTLNRLTWEILNATADDYENLEQIYHQICFEPVETMNAGKQGTCGCRPIADAPFLSEIANGIRSLVENGWLTALMDEEGRPLQDLDDLSYVWRAWFSMTSEGRKVWESSQQLIEQE